LYNDDELQNWQLTDPFDSHHPGMSVENAYNTILKGIPATTVIVAVVDAGIDINHEDLKDVIWKNTDEIPNNGIDDDRNGYIDDINGWNFLGAKDGKMATGEQLELTRIVKKYRSMWKDKSINDISADDTLTYKMYLKAEKDYTSRIETIKPLEARLDGYKKLSEPMFKALREHLKIDKLTPEAVKAIKTDDDAIKNAKAMYMKGLTPDYIKGFSHYVDGQLKYNLNLDFNGRVQGDDPDDYNDRDYGNPNVIPPSDNELHGTHVAGIIAAMRNNGKGGNGVADHVLIMPVRAVPDGDEYDKDIALAFRYAVDNGAKVINTSFGKYFSPHKEWVWDAIKYAEKHDVLIVNGVGNEGKNMDLYGDDMSYPNDGDVAGKEFADNFLNVGATSPNFGADLVAPFSNYGKETVDVFSPGMKIYATVPFNKYKHLQGTSMASPDVAGVAALIRSRFPKLSASEVKHVIMDSGLAPQIYVIVPQEDDYEGEPKLMKFSELSKSGKMVNAYNALVMAKKLSANK
jgi:subtilisin family serine protease